LSDFNPTRNASEVIYASPLLEAEGNFDDIVIKENPDGVINTNEVEYYAQTAAYYGVVIDILSDENALNALSDYNLIRSSGDKKTQGAAIDALSECKEIGFLEGSEEFQTCLEKLSDR